VGNGFRAPTLYDLHEPQLRTPLLFFEDPARCPVTQADRDCILTTQVLGGNPDLEPETSTQVNAGMVWEPVPGMSLAVDYWNIRKRNFVGSLNTGHHREHFARFESTEHRPRSRGSRVPALPGPIETVVLTCRTWASSDFRGRRRRAMEIPASAYGRFKALAQRHLYDRMEVAARRDQLGVRPSASTSSVRCRAGGMRCRSTGTRARGARRCPRRFQSGYEDFNFFPRV
jgi:hypothetical protein